MMNKGDDRTNTMASVQRPSRGWTLVAIALLFAAIVFWMYGRQRPEEPLGADIPAMMQPDQIGNTVRSNEPTLPSGDTLMMEGEGAAVGPR